MSSNYDTDAIITYFICAIYKNLNQGHDAVKTLNSEPGLQVTTKHAFTMLLEEFAKLHIELKMHKQVMWDIITTNKQTIITFVSITNPRN